MSGFIALHSPLSLIKRNAYHSLERVVGFHDFSRDNPFYLDSPLFYSTQMPLKPFLSATLYVVFFEASCALTPPSKYSCVDVRNAFIRLFITPIQLIFAAFNLHTLHDALIDLFKIREVQFFAMICFIALILPEHPHNEAVPPPMVEVGSD